jgi:shikimate dehydrogenase
MSKKFGVLGSPISHSLSPAIHAAAYAVMQEDWVYERFQVEKEDLLDFLSKSEGSFAGFSLTMPLKERAFEIATVADQISSITKATNTLVWSGGKWQGSNTDVFGISKSLAGNISGSINKVLILGSGATAVSAITAISQSFPSSKVFLHARNLKKVSELLKFSKALGLRARRARFLKSRMLKADVVISTLPSGVLNLVAANFSGLKKFKPRGALLDVAYNPWPSDIAKVWSASGSLVISGKEMLIWQALAQIRIFKSGDVQLPLHNEDRVLEAMRAAAQQ